MDQTQIDHLISAAPEQLQEILGELAPHIQTAAAQTLSQTAEQEGGGKPKLRVGLSVVIDLAKSPPAWHCEGSVGLRVKAVGKVLHENRDEEWG